MKKLHLKCNFMILKMLEKILILILILPKLLNKKKILKKFNKKLKKSKKAKKTYTQIPKYPFPLQILMSIHNIHLLYKN